MEKEVGFIDAIIRELLDFSRPSRTEDQRVSLNGIVEEALRMLSFHKAMRGVRVSSEPDSLNPEVMGSRKELLQAVLNLALNAAQAVNSDGEVRLRVSSGSGDIPEGRAAIFISDTGPGVPPEQVGKIFDPFYTTRRGGTGLGLSITFRIVQRHGGEITVLQQGGPGAVFRILLPLADSPAGD
jgi:signal transduction histidine kinase